MATKIFMNVSDGDECRIAVVENGILQEYFVDRPSQLTHVGDVYRGVVTNVESAIQAAFVDLGYKKNAFLHVTDVIPAYQEPVSLSKLYGSKPVEIIPVEEIDFNLAPDREVELDEDGEMLDGGSSEEDDDADELDDSGFDGDIDAPAIVDKSRYERSRDEEGIRQTVELERTVHVGEDTSQIDADKQSRDSNYGELDEERAKAEARRRKGERRNLTVEERKAQRRREREASDAGAPTSNGTAKPSAPVAPSAAALRILQATSPRPAVQEVSKPQPKQEEAPALVPVKPAESKIELPEPSVEAKARPRFKVEVKRAPAPAPVAPKSSSELPAPAKPVVEALPAVEAKAPPRVKLSRSKPVDGGGSKPAEWLGAAMGFGGPSSLDTSPRPRSALARENPDRRFRRMALPKLQNVLHRGQEMLVQVTRAAQGGKGPSVTTYVSLPGRYMVLMPNTSKCGVSRKIKNNNVRTQLYRNLRRLRIPEGMGVIIRTAAAGRPIEELQRDLNYLLKLWNQILEDVNSGKRSPSCCYRDSDPAIRTVRDYFTRDVSEIVIDDRDVYDRVMAFFDDLMPDYRDRVRLYTGGVPLFVREGIEPQIEHIFDKKVPLPSGGYLFVEQTEALVAIDVNSGRFTSESNAEDTAYKTNLEAVPEIVRQLRLRDLGGIVVGDFIDMMESRHRREVEERLKAELRKGRARVKVATTSPFGLIEMTRQRVRPSIRVYTYSECPTCKGFGHVMSEETQALRLIRAVRLVLANDESDGAVVSAPAGVLSYLHSHLRGELQKIEKHYEKPVTFEWDPSLSSEELRLWFINRRGDRTTFNLDAEMARHATGRQLGGIDSGSSGRRRRRKPTGRRDGDLAIADKDDSDDKNTSAGGEDSADNADVEIVDFERRGSGDRRGRRGPQKDRRNGGQQRRDDDSRGRRDGSPRPQRDAAKPRDGAQDNRGGPPAVAAATDENGEAGGKRRRRRRRGGRRNRPQDARQASGSDPLDRVHAMLWMTAQAVSRGEMPQDALDALIDAAAELSEIAEDLPEDGDGTGEQMQAVLAGRTRLAHAVEHAFASVPAGVLEKLSAERPEESEEGAFLGLLFEALADAQDAGDDDAGESSESDSEQTAESEAVVEEEPTESEPEAKTPASKTRKKSSAKSTKPTSGEKAKSKTKSDPEPEAEVDDTPVLAKALYTELGISLPELKELAAGVGVEVKVWNSKLTGEEAARVRAASGK